MKSNLLHIIARPLEVLRRIFSKGLTSTLRRGAFLAYEAYREWRLGIDTGGFIHWHELGADPSAVDYDPIGYRTLDRALRQLDIRPGHDVFLDYGCGKGRAVLTAAIKPFRRVLGIEMSSQLCDRARENVRRAATRLRCADVEIINVDAAAQVVPDDVSVIFLFNPFTGHMLKQSSTEYVPHSAGSRAS